MKKNTIGEAWDQFKDSNTSRLGSVHISTCCDCSAELDEIKARIRAFGLESVFQGVSGMRKED